MRLANAFYSIINEDINERINNNHYRTIFVFGSHLYIGLHINFERVHFILNVNMRFNMFNTIDT